MRTEVRERILKRDKYKCNYCDSNENLEVDHIIPISKGGYEDELNMQILCLKCNRKKSNKIDYSKYFVYNEREDALLISVDLPMNAITSNELMLIIEQYFKYGRMD